MAELDDRFDRVGSVLIGQGNFLTFVLILVPLFLELVVRFGSNHALIVVGAGAAFFFIIMSLLYWFASHSRFRYSASMGVAILGYSAFYAMSGDALNPYAFIGVLPAGLMIYAYGFRGRLLSHLLVANITTYNYLFHMWDSGSGWVEFTRLISYLALIVLIIEFVNSSVELSKQEMRDVMKSGHQIRVEHQRLLSLINNIGDAVIATDYDGVIQTYNGAALELLDTNISITGKQLEDVLDLVDKQGREVDLIGETRQLKRTIRRNDVILRYAPGDLANIYVNVTPIKVGYGLRSEKGFTLILRDITREKSLEEERDEFISVVSHELRTPVTITEGKVSNALLLLDKQRGDEDKLKQSLGEAHKQVVYLSNMINDLAALARAERVENRMDLERVDPRQLVEELAASFQLPAKEKGLELKTAISGQNLPSLYTSRLYLQEVLQNFLTNALKYTKEGGITLGVEAAGGSQVAFEISDTGIGISKSDQKRLFEKFFRSEDYRTRESSGTGLGLYVTHKLINKLQGKVEVESRLNEGSTFRLRVGSLEEKPRRPGSGS